MEDCTDVWAPASLPLSFFFEVVPRVNNCFWVGYSSNLKKVCLSVIIEVHHMRFVDFSGSKGLTFIVPNTSSMRPRLTLFKPYIQALNALHHALSFLRVAG